MRRLPRVRIVIAAGVLAASLVVATPVSAGTASLTIVKDANPANGTDFDFIAIGPGVGAAVPTYLSQFATTGTRATVNSQGDVLVTDLTANKVLVYDETGAFQFDFGVGILDQPRGIAVDSNDNIYVANSGTVDQVRKFSPAGALLTSWVGAPGFAFDNLQGIAVDANDNVFTVDRDGGSGRHLQKFDDAGTPIAQAGVHGTGNGQFQSPQDLAIDSTGAVFVGDLGALALRMQRFSNSLVYETQWGSGAGAWAPFSVEVGPDDSVYSTDLGAARQVQRFDRDGVFKGAWGSLGTGNGEFQIIQGMTIDQRNNDVYVVDSGSRVQRFEYPNKFTLDDAVPDDTDGVTSSKTYNSLDAATYEITELVPAGWVVASASCTGGTDSGTLKGTTLSVALGTGENVTCTITNEPKIPASLTVVKDSNPDDGTDFSFTVDAASITTANFDLDDAVPDDTDGVDSSNALTGLDPDTFTISEVVPADWNLDSAACTGGSDAGTLAGSDLTVFVGNGEDVTCTFTNTRTTAQLTVVKDASPPDGTDFDFTVDSPTISPINFSLDDAVPDDTDGVNESHTIASLTPGNFTISEVIPTDWTLNSAVCTGGTDSGTLVGSDLTVALAGGENVTCTFTNASTMAQLTVVKDASPAIGTDFDFTLETPLHGYDFEWTATGPAIASDGAGLLYSSVWPATIIKWSDDGTQLLTFGNGLGAGNGQFGSAPRGLAVDSLGNVWAVDPTNDRVQKFDSTGNYLDQFGSFGTGDGQFDDPAFIAIDSNDNMFVTEVGNHRIQKFNSAGSFVAKVGTLGMGNTAPSGQFWAPYGIAVDSTDDVFVADLNNDRVQRFDSSLTFEAIWGSPGLVEGDLNQPYNLAVDPAGDVYLVDFYWDAVLKFDRDGLFIDMFGHDSPNPIASAEGITADHLGNIFVLDSGGNNKIQKFTRSFDFQLDDAAPDDADGVSESITFPVEPGTYDVDEILPPDWMIESLSCVGGADSGTISGTAVTIAVAGGESIACTYKNRKPGSLTVIKESVPADGTDFEFSVSGIGVSAAYEFERDWSGNGTGDGQFQSPVAIAVGPSGDVFVADETRDDVQRFDSLGNFVSKFGAPGGADGQFSDPSGIDVDSGGNIYVSDRTANRVQKFDNAGVFLTKWGTAGSAAGQFQSPQKLAVGPSGNVYVADQGNDRIQKFDSSGGFLTTWGSTGTADGEFVDPFGIGVGPNGDVVVSQNSFTVKPIQRFDSSGTFLGNLGTPSSGPRPDVAVDSVGNIIVMHRGSYKFQKFLPNGALLGEWGVLGSGPGGFVTAFGLALDANGDLYTLDKGWGEVQKFNPRIDFILDDAAPDDADAHSDTFTLFPTPATGSFAITDVGAFSWRLDSAGCSGGVDPGSLVGTTLSIDMALGEDITCTFSNVPAPALTVVSPMCVVYDSVTSGDGPLVVGTPRTVPITGVSGCVPAGATSAVLTVTAKSASGAGNLRVSEAGVAPAGGVVNYVANGLDNTNTIAVPLSVDGAVDIAANGNDAGVRVAVAGYYSASGTQEFFPLTPCVFADSRASQPDPATFGFAGPFNVGGGSQFYDVVGSFNQGASNQGGGNSDCGVPSSATHVMVNAVSIAASGGNGGIAVGDGWPAPPPLESTTNYAPIGLNNAAVAIAPVSPGVTGGKITARIVGAGSTEVRLVVLGYFEATNGDAYSPVNPCAAFDSRTTVGGDTNPATGLFAGKRIAGTSGTNLTGLTTYNVTGAVPAAQGGELACGVPEGAKAVLINLVAIQADAVGNFRAFASGSSPTGGVLNFSSLALPMNNSNAVVVPLSAAGNMDLFVNAPLNDGNSTVHARGVILGYYS